MKGNGIVIQLKQVLDYGLALLQELKLPKSTQTFLAFTRKSLESFDWEGMEIGIESHKIDLVTGLTIQLVLAVMRLGRVVNDARVKNNMVSIKWLETAAELDKRGTTNDR